MKEKQYDPARQNEKAPAAGMAAVDTHNPDELPEDGGKDSMKPEDDERRKVSNTDNDRQ